MKIAVVTIAAKNYFSHVRTLAKSLQQHRPDWDRFAVMADAYTDEGSQRALCECEELYTLIHLNALELPNPEKMSFRYTLLEFNTAVKPWALSFLFRQGYDAVVYLDPDILVYGPMEELDPLLCQTDAMILTPHLTMPSPNNTNQSEQDLMRVGVFNLGFIALGKGKQTDALLRWWQEKLEFQCEVDKERGLFVDQKWMDFVPCFYSNVHVLRDDGYNVAYWNQKVRNAEERDGQVFFNGRPLQFFHFSFAHYLDPKNDVIQSLLQSYQRVQLQNGKEQFAIMPYAFAAFSDGRLVNGLMRKHYKRNSWVQKACGKNPFDCPEIFFAPPKSKESIAFSTFILDEIWLSRPDLQRAFPDCRGVHRAAYLQWIEETAPREGMVDESFAKKVHLEQSKLVEQSKLTHTPLMEGGKKAMVKRMIKSCLRRTKPIVKPILLRFVSAEYLNAAKNKVKLFLRPSLRKRLKAEGALPNTRLRSANTGNPKYISRARKAKKRGVSLFSFIRGEFGIGEIGRITARNLEATHIDFDVVSIPETGTHRFTDDSWDHKIVTDPKYNVMVCAANADTAESHSRLFAEQWKGRYNIGLWNWELPEFPDEWRDSFKLFHEIWAPSRFTMEAIRAKSPIPVTLMPPSIVCEADAKMGRAYFGLPEDNFLFLCMYDVFSIQNRKNPQGAIDSFLEAFAGRSDVDLVIKVNNSEYGFAQKKALEALSKEHPNIRLLYNGFSRMETNSLIQCVDSFVSLHRSEGFGLVVGEAMYLGKPVVATHWSGNVDMMTERNSCPVHYTLRSIEQDEGPYRVGQIWAHPDIAHAAQYMKRLVEDSAYYSSVAEAAHADIRQNFSPERCGGLIRERLDALRLL